MKNLAKTKYLLTIIALTIVLFVSVGVSFAWLANREKKVNVQTLSGELLTRYFHCGTGTETDPFVITRPLHYYNLVNLYQRVEDYSDQHYYFQVGYEFVKDSGEFWVYNYEDDGTIISGGENTDNNNYALTKTLNLKYYSGENSLLPIGTHDKNFLGVFDGKGLTISGLTVASQFIDAQNSANNKNICDIGVFGYVGGEFTQTLEDNSQVVCIPTIKDVYFENVTIDLTGATNNVSNVTTPQTHNPSVHTVEENTLSYVGYIAGHVVVGSSFQNVFVNSVTISGGNASTSNFGYFGCIETSDGSAVPTLASSIIKEYGDEIDWGGSIDMKAMYNRLVSINNNYAQTKTTAPTIEKRFIDGDNIRIEFSGSGNIDSDAGSNKYYSSEYAGKYYLYHMSNQYMGLVSGAPNPSKTLITITYRDDVLEGYRFSSNGHYLSVSNGQLGGNNQSVWLFDESGHLYNIFDSGKVDGKNVNNENDGKKYYLYVTNAGSLAIQESAPSTTWELTENGLITRPSGSNKDYHLEYSNALNKWVITSIETPCIISDNNGHFLSADINGQIISSNLSNSINWQLSNQNGDTTFYTEIDGKSYYLEVENGSLKLNQPTGTPDTWHYDSENKYYYCEENGNSYYLTYNNGWILNKYFVINDNNGNYLVVNGNNSFSNTTSDENATRFFFSSGSGASAYGKVYCYDANGTKYFINNNAGTLRTGTAENNATTWNNNGNNFYSNNYYLVCKEETWMLVSSVTQTKYLFNIKSGSNYAVLANEELANNTTKPSTKLWTFDDGYIYALDNSGEKYYLTYDSARNNVEIKVTKTINLTGIKTWVFNGSNIQTEESSWYYIRYNGGWVVSYNSSNRATIEDQETISTTYYSRSEEKMITNYTAINTQPIQTSFINTPSQQRMIDRDEKTNQPGGYETYFPIRTVGENETWDGHEDWQNDTNTYKVSPMNTGYIVSGAKIYDIARAGSYDRQLGDIRISRYGIDYIRNSFAGSAFKVSNQNYGQSENKDNIYTVNADNGIHVFNDTNASKAYFTAKEQLRKTLASDTSYVYGLHFMNAEISQSRLTTVPVAVVAGKKYVNYQMPLDSIDFNVKSTGSIRFFAGEYYSGNSTFFSLHQVFRDENNDISAIREIQEVWEYNGEGENTNKKYIYKFKSYNGKITYTNANGSYSETTTKPANYGKLVFNTDWITSPNNFQKTGQNTLSQSNRRIFYFEIPCNPGEYALGSVSGKTGAYLIYLDIGTNGSSRVSMEGNGLTQNKFLVDTRSPDFKFNLEKTNPEDHSLLQIAVDAPTGANLESFSVKLFYDDKKKLYTLEIVNKTSVDINLTVFICDDNNDPFDDYPYWYEVKYKNKTYSDWQNIVDPQIPDEDKTKFQRCGNINIKNTGDSKPNWVL